MTRKPKIGQFKRDVSIIGVGCSVFSDILLDPRIQGWTWRELWADAVSEALDDAHLNPKDIDMFLIGNMIGETMMKNVCLHGAASYWGGMNLTPGVEFNAACATTNIGLQLGAGLVASGMRDIVMVSGVEILNSRIDGDNPIKRVNDREAMLRATGYGGEPGYWYPNGGASTFWAMPTLAYAKQYDVPIPKIEEVITTICINQRCNAVRNPKSVNYNGKTFADLAHDTGFQSDKEYLNSKYNPYSFWPLRARASAMIVDGASAYIIAPTEMAKDLVETPIHVLGVGASTTLPLYNESPCNPTDVEAFRQAYEMAGIEGKDLDCLSIHDCNAGNYITVSENAGYLPRGEAIDAILKGRMKPNGDKPVNTTGGRIAFGHAWAASGGAEVYEAVKQMRGQAVNQVLPLPKLYGIHHYGHGMVTSIMVLNHD